MLFFTLSLVTILILTTNGVSCLQEDYYWREYTGSIPSDAVIGGRDINSNYVYIGQAYIHNEGLIVVHIYPGLRQVYAPIKGIKKADTGIKVLCGPQHNFYWSRANSTHLHLLLIDKHAVIGGYSYGWGDLNIGRISHRGEAKIGKINSYNIGNAVYHFNDNGTEQGTTSYEILLYKNNNIDVKTVPAN